MMKKNYWAHQKVVP